MTMTMTMTNAISRTPETQYQIGTFGVDEYDCAIAAAALEIAKRMGRGANDTEADITRAVILIAGAGLGRELGDSVYGVDEADIDRQIVAYMDGVSELMARFPLGHND